MKLSEQTKIEAQIGFTSGILVGAIAAWFFLMFFAGFEWYFKVFSTLGSIGIVGSLTFALIEQIKVRRNYLEMKKEIENAHRQSIVIIDDMKGGYNGNKEERI